MRTLFFEAFRFALVGLAATFTHLAVALAALTIGVETFIANLIGFIVALGASITGHHLFSFPGRVPFIYGATRFMIGAVLAFSANCLVLFALTHTNSPFAPWLRLTISIVVMPIVSFIYSRSFAYRRKHDGGVSETLPPR